MNSNHLTYENLDIWHLKTSILNSLIEILPNLKGTLVDLGCGDAPFKSLITRETNNKIKYVGIDLYNNIYNGKPDVFWDGQTIPIRSNSVDTVLFTEVIEHIQNPDIVLVEINRILKVGGVVFLTTPFFWPLHDAPFDEYRYTPFSLERILKKHNFCPIKTYQFGGWNACLAQMLGLWLRRKPMNKYQRKFLSIIFKPIVHILLKTDKSHKNQKLLPMYTGLSILCEKGHETQ